MAAYLTSAGAHLISELQYAVYMAASPEGLQSALDVFNDAYSALRPKVKAG